MRRFAFAAFAALIVGGIASTAQAQCVNNGPCANNGQCANNGRIRDQVRDKVRTTLDQMERDRQRVSCWPHPWVFPDRAAAQAPFIAQVAKGWKQQTTVSDYHFEDNGATLTKAGQMKVKWIINNVPDPFRTVYVQQADGQQETTRRLDDVQQYLANRVTGDPLPAVLPTRHGEPGHSAEYAYDVYSKFRNTIPNPRIVSQQTADDANNQ